MKPDLKQYKAFVFDLNGTRIDLFESVCPADDVTQRKPNPEMYNLTLEWMGLEPQETIFFEDRPAGVKAAQSAGGPVIMIDNKSGRSVDGVEQFTWRNLF